MEMAYISLLDRLTQLESSLLSDQKAVSKRLLEEATSDANTFFGSQSFTAFDQHILSFKLPPFPSQYLKQRPASDPIAEALTQSRKPIHDYLLAA
jgi:hypothetical protein